jgi:hypothetical protein
MEALLEMDEYEEGKEKGSTAAAASDPDVIYVEAAAINDPEISVVYTKHWSSEDHNDKNGKQAKLKEFPDENEMTKYWQYLRRTENFNQGNQEEVDNLVGKCLRQKLCQTLCIQRRPRSRSWTMPRHWKMHIRQRNVAKNVQLRWKNPKSGGNFNG